jgi:hypothetical protein
MAYPLHFAALYPSQNTSGVVHETGAYTFEFNVNGTRGSFEDQLFAEKNNVTMKPVDGKVRLDFKHIFSKINYAVSTSQGVTVEIQHISLRGLARDADFTCGVPGMSWGNWSTLTSNYQSVGAPVMPENIFTDATAAPVALKYDFPMIIPQTGRGWAVQAAPTVTTDAYLEVEYRVYETATGKDIIGFSDATEHPRYADLGDGETGALFVKVGYSLPTVWEPGKAYNYVLHLGDPAYTGGNLIDDTFQDKDGNDTLLPVINPQTKEPIEIPDPMYTNSNEIGFVVDVSDWDVTTPGIDF